MTTHAGPSIDSVEGIGALTLGGFLDEVVSRFGPNEAVVIDDPLLGGETVRWTYDQLGEVSHRIARALIATGVGRGDTVGILMGNRPESLASIFGAALAGAVAAPMSTFSTASELTHMVATCKARVVLTQNDLKGRRFPDDLAKIAEEHAALRDVVVLGEDSWSEFLNKGEACPESAVEERIDAANEDEPAPPGVGAGTGVQPK
jgi:acyl-CoA synthetase (AMP-forming)/AMP-acid ligase II